MEPQDEILFKEKAIKNTWTIRALTVLTTIFLFVGVYVAWRAPEGVAKWPWCIPFVIGSILLFVQSKFSKATITITKSVKGALHCDVKTDKVILQGPPTSVYYWVRLESEFRRSSNYVLYIELKTKYGDVLGMQSPISEHSIDKLEIRNTGFDRDVKSYKIRGGQRLIIVLEEEGIRFSYK